MDESPFPFAEKGEWVGHWWLPENPDNRVAGTLIYDGEGGLNLKLDNHFDGYNPDEVGEIDEDESGNLGRLVRDKDLIFYDVIYGVADGINITIMDAMDKSPWKPWGRIGKNYISNCKISAEKLILGRHVENKDSKVFGGLRVSVDNLGFWYLSAEEKKEIDFEGRYIELCNVNEIEASDGDDLFCRILVNDGVSLEEGLEEAHVIQNFISFVTNQPSGIVWLQLEDAEDVSNSDNKCVSIICSRMKIGKGYRWAGSNSDARLVSEAFPFAESLAKWFKLVADARAAVNMVMAIQLEDMPFIENDLLAVTGAAEVLHRNLNIRSHMYDAAEFKKMKKEIMNVVPAWYKETAMSNLRNDPSLRIRLIDLADSADKDSILYLVPDVEYWAKKTVKARNDLTHKGVAPKQSADELLAIVDATKAIIRLAIMDRLGVSKEYQNEIVKNYRQYITAARRAGEWLTPPPEEITKEKQNNTDA